MSTFITRVDPSGTGPTLAVKDLIDMEGMVTTAGCRALADTAPPASADAACMLGARAAGARIVGRTNLHELAYGVSGVNPWYGTPTNPLDPARVPGGSSSGSAVAVATGEAEVAYGSDTGGSVRIPAACCGTSGLKTTWGRVPLAGVWPLAPSLDTVGPLARDVGGLVTGMGLLEPGFSVSDRSWFRVGHLPVDAEPAIVAAIGAALAVTEWDVVELALPGWEGATEAAREILAAEAWASDQATLEAHPDKVGADVAARLRRGRDLGPDGLREARAVAQRWRAELAASFEQVDLIATPTLTIFPPGLDQGESLLGSRCTMPVNLAGVPALALPVPAGGPLPASLQLIGPEGSEEDLLAAGLVLEAAVRSLR